MRTSKSPRALRHLLASLLVAAAASPACSSGSSGGGASPAAVQSYIASLCSFYARCGLDYSAQVASQQRVVAGFVLDSMSGLYLSLCSDKGRTDLATEVNYQLGLPDVGTVDVAALARTIDGASCDGRPPSPNVVGARAVGRACVSDGQCSTGECSGSSNACGECVQPIAVGGACSANDPKSVCANGSTCSGGICKAEAAQKKAGDSCAQASDCPTAAGLTCTAGKCTSFVANLGESCAQKVCRGSVCDATSKVCVAYKTSGACSGSLHCDVFNGYACEDATKTCVKFTGTQTRAKVGDACGTQPDGTNTRCVPGAACVSSKCVDATTTCTAP